MKTFNVEYFTDPLCCWSWAFEPQFRKLRFLLKDRLRYRYRMSGMLITWKQYSDPFNDISCASQMGPLWMQAKHYSGQPLDTSIWVDNPVDTSLTACLAVKAAELQGRIAGEAMLRKLREAVMMHKRNIGQTQVLLEIAEELEETGVLKFQEFKKDLSAPKTSTTLREDMELVRIKSISRFPTLLVSTSQKTLQITGYRPFEVLSDTFRLLDPDLDLSARIDEEEYKSSWESLTKRELEEIRESPKKACTSEIASAFS